MITCYLQGGLGNQLFIIITTLAYALRHNQPVLFHYSDKLTGGCTLRYTFWDTFLFALKPLTTTLSIPLCKVIRENTDGYRPTPSTPVYGVQSLTCAYGSQRAKPAYVVRQRRTTGSLQIEPPLGENRILTGYFQSYKYFDQEYPEIARMVGIQWFRNKYNVYFTNLGQIRDVCISMHFRLGDYKKVKGTVILPIDYYIQSLEYILPYFYRVHNLNHNPQILYFCEEEDILTVNGKIAILKNKFPQCVFHHVPNTYQDWEQMIIMSLCAYNIVANSTFSWWGAYIGYRDSVQRTNSAQTTDSVQPNTLVCYPFFEKDRNSGLYPESWYKVMVQK